MERRTYKIDNEWCIAGANGALTGDNHGNFWGPAIDKLAAYENTGLTPQDIQEAVDKLNELSRELEKYKKDEAEGRLLRIPFVEGDIVHFIDIHSSGEELGKRYVRSGLVTRVSLAGMYVCVNTSTLPLSLPFESVYSTTEEAKEAMEKKYGKKEEA